MGQAPRSSRTTREVHQIAMSGNNVQVNVPTKVETPDMMLQFTGISGKKSTVYVRGGIDVRM